MQTGTTRRSNNIIFFSGIILLFTFVSIAAANAAFLITNKIYHGVKIGDIPVGGLSYAQAEEKVSRYYAEQFHKTLIIVYNSYSWEITPEEIDLKVDAALAAQQAFSIGRTGSIFNQFKERYLAINRGHVLPMPFVYDRNKLGAVLVNISRSIDREPVSATIVLHGAKIVIEPEVIGRRVSIDATSENFGKKLVQGMPLEIDLSVDEIKPAVTSRDLLHINAVIASYTTQFDPRDTNRSENIRLAAKSLDNVLVRSNDIFSFNAYVGPRLAKYGYKEAPVFIEGKLLPDFGGGVCQVSSTLYNAALLADMEIEERTPHFRPPGYVPIGQDATVADNLLDFKFKNTSPDNIYLKTEVTDNTLTVTIFGNQATRPYEIRVVALEKKALEPTTVIKQDQNLDLGKEIIESEGQKGFQVTTYRIKMRQGEEISREMIASDEYKPVDRVVRIGAKQSKLTGK